MGFLVDRFVVPSQCMENGRFDFFASRSGLFVSRVSNGETSASLSVSPDATTVQLGWDWLQIHE